MASSRKALLSLSPYIAVVALLGLAELALRTWDHALDNPLTNEVTYDGIEWYQINRGYLKKYFPVNTPLIPEFKTSVFRKQKLPTTFRVFCLGESSMFGTPYQMTCNIPGMVRKQLRHLYPDRDIEVVNWGASAINTNVIADLASRLVAYQPDLVLIYTGHNEFYGPDGVGASFLQRHFSFTIPLEYRLRDLRLVTFLSNTLFKKGASETPATLNLMEQVSRGSTVPLGSPAAERIFDLFASNLRSIIRIFEGAHIPLIVSDVSSNLTFPPFISDSLPPGRDQMLASCESLCKSGRFQHALEVAGWLWSTDSANALVDFWRGKTELSLGDREDARRHLARARDLDLLKFRAPSKIDEITRQICIDEGVPFVSADSLFAAMSNTGVAGDDFFWEHLHPTPKGYYAISDMFVEEIVRLGIPGRTPQVSLLPFDVDSLSICWLDQAYGDLSIRHLTGRWPFADYHRLPWVLDSADAVMLRIAGEVYQRKAAWEDACYQLAAYFWKVGKLRAAETTYEAMLEEYPFSYHTHYLVGSLLNQQYELGPALEHYRRSIELNPFFTNSLLDRGLIEVNAGEFDAALQDLSAALKAAEIGVPNQVKASIYYGLAAAYANKGDLNRALAEIDTSLQLQPGYQDALNLRSRLSK